MEDSDLVPYLPVTPTSALVLDFARQGDGRGGSDGLLFVRFVMVADYAGIMEEWWFDIAGVEALRMQKKSWWSGLA